MAYPTEAATVFNHSDNLEATQGFQDKDKDNTEEKFNTVEEYWEARKHKLATEIESPFGTLKRAIKPVSSAYKNLKKAFLTDPLEMTFFAMATGIFLGGVVAPILVAQGYLMFGLTGLSAGLAAGALIFGVGFALTLAGLYIRALIVNKKDPALVKLENVERAEAARNARLEADEIPNGPISKDQLEDPIVVTCCGANFEKEYWSNHVGTNSNDDGDVACPCCREKVTVDMVFPDTRMKAHIDKLVNNSSDSAQQTDYVVQAFTSTRQVLSGAVENRTREGSEKFPSSNLKIPAHFDLKAILNNAKKEAEFLSRFDNHYPEDAIFCVPVIEPVMLNKESKPADQNYHEKSSLVKYFTTHKQTGALATQEQLAIQRRTGHVQVPKNEDGVAFRKDCPATRIDIYESIKDNKIPQLSIDKQKLADLKNLPAYDILKKYYDAKLLQHLNGVNQDSEWLRAYDNLDVIFGRGNWEPEGFQRKDTAQRNRNR